MDCFLLLEEILGITLGRSQRRKLKFCKYSGTKRSVEGTQKSKVEQRDRRELQGMVNNKGDDHGTNEVKRDCGLPSHYNCESASAICLMKHF